MRSVITDKCVSSSMESTTMRSRTFTDAKYQCPSHSKACYKRPEAQSTESTGPEDLMQTTQKYLHGDQRDEGTTKATVRGSEIGTNDWDEKSISVGEATGQASKGQARESESAFDRLRAMPEDRQYTMRRFLGEEIHQLADAVVAKTEGLSYTDDEVGESMNHLPPQQAQTPLDPNLLMIGAFAEDFYETYDRTLEPEALAKEYLAYESCFDKPHEKPGKLKNCSNSF